MRPAARWISVAAMVGAAGAPGLFGAAPAWADSLSAQVDAASWYWAEQTVTAPEAGALPVGTPREASGVPAGDLGVSYTTDVDKVAALGLGVSGAPTGSVFDAYTVTMPLDPAAQQLAPPNAAPQLSACAALDPVLDGADPGALTAAPTQNSVECVDGKFDAGKSAWVFEISSLATDWASGVPANGVVVRPKLGDATQFNYAFLGKKDIKVEASYTAPAAPVTAPVAPPADSGSGFVPAPSLDSGSVAITPAQPVTPVAPQPQVMPAPAPAVAAPATTPVAAIAVDALRPSGLFWLALLGFGALLLMAGAVLGDPMEPIVLDARRRRFADVIRARAAARAAATATRPAVSTRPRHA